MQTLALSALRGAAHALEAVGRQFARPRVARARAALVVREVDGVEREAGPHWVRVRVAVDGGDVALVVEVEREVVDLLRQVEGGEVRDLQDRVAQHAGCPGCAARALLAEADGQLGLKLDVRRAGRSRIRHLLAIMVKSNAFRCTCGTIWGVLDRNNDMHPLVVEPRDLDIRGGGVCGAVLDHSELQLVVLAADKDRGVLVCIGPGHAGRRVQELGVVPDH
eukprot:663474-Rhodomonas_salina.1